jgi:hypothetical protein
MAGLGGFSPAPRVFGEAKATDLEALQRVVAEAHGTALASERGTTLWVENHATARVLLGLYRTAERLAHVNDPQRMTETLVRWERIFGLNSVGTLNERRARVAAKKSLLSAGTALSVVHDYLTDLLGAMYLGLSFGDPLTATTYVPDGGTIPGGGPTFLDGNLVPPEISPYASSLAHVAILLEKPVGMSEDEFYDRAGGIYGEVDNLLGAWMRFSVIRDGVNGIGFFLDEANNLDNQRFRI